MSECELRERTIGLVLRPNKYGSELFKIIAASAESVKRPFARAHRDPVLRNQIYAKGPDPDISSLRETILSHSGLKEFNYNCVEVRR